MWPQNGLVIAKNVFSSLKKTNRMWHLAQLCFRTKETFCWPFHDFDLKVKVMVYNVLSALPMSYCVYILPNLSLADWVCVYWLSSCLMFFKGIEDWVHETFVLCCLLPSLFSAIFRWSSQPDNPGFTKEPPGGNEGSGCGCAQTHHRYWWVVNVLVEQTLCH